MGNDDVLTLVPIVVVLIEVGKLVACFNSVSQRP